MYIQYWKFTRKKPSRVSLPRQLYPVNKILRENAHKYNRNGSHAIEPQKDSTHSFDSEFVSFIGPLANQKV
jgi:hypothetical protein